MAKSGGWTEGLSATSIGRFGGWNGRYVHRVNGFLALSATADELFAEHDRSINLGRFELAQPHSVHTEADWVCVRHEMRNPAGKRIARVWQSLLSPGVLFESSDSHFTWFNDRSNQILDFIWPGRRGTKTILSSLPLGKDLVEPWCLGLNEAVGGKITPLLFVFHKRPAHVHNANSDYHDFQFRGKAGLVAVMPLYGPARVARKDLLTAGGRLRADVLAHCRFWARALLAYPIACREDYRVDLPGGAVTIRNRIQYVTAPNDWNWQPTRLAPVPPILPLAAERGYPIAFDRKLIDTGIRTYVGPLKAVEGDEFSYTLGLPTALEQTIAPVRIRNSAPAAKLSVGLKKYLAKPDLTFGGDDTYDPNNIQDVLHDMRVLAWATWSLDDADRRKAAARMLRGLRHFDGRNFRRWDEPFTGGAFIAEKAIWRDSHGDVTYDYEWYNGMQLAGLWAGMQFLGKPEKFRKLLTDKWDLVEGLTAYFDLFNDWATGTFWTDIPGEFLHMDGWHYGWQGIVGAYCLAGELGKTGAQHRAAYLAAKSAVARWVSWLMNDYVAEAAAAGLKEPTRRGKKPDMNAMLVGGMREAQTFAIDTTFSPGNALGYMTPEMWLMYLDEPRIVDRLRAGQYRHLPKMWPGWNVRPKVWGYGKGPHPYPSHWHFYRLDDHLFVRAMVLREPQEKLLRHTPYLSGPVMEAALVAGAPMVVLPTRAAFGGNEWDARAKTLTVQLDAPVPGLELGVMWPGKPKSIEGATVSSRPKRKTDRLRLTLPAGKVEVKIRY